MVFTGFYILSTCFDDSPIIFDSWVSWTICIETSILQLLFIFWNPTE
jgi:hypothetical protein